MVLSDFTILMVEDDPNDILLTQRAFMQARLVNPLRVVRDGEAAIQYLGGQGMFADRTRYPLPSLVLLNLEVPKRSGLEVLEFIRSEAALRRTPVIVLTSSEENADVRKACALGANSHLVKPVGFDGLVEMIKAIGLYWVILNQGPVRAIDPSVPRREPARGRAAGI